MEKILLCGSDGFIISNFIRYLLYRTKKYEIISVDNLSDFENHKNAYLNSNNKFYLGDVCDKQFIETLVNLEKPDYIINGCFYKSNNYKTILEGTQNLQDTSLPLIHICMPDKLFFNTFLSKLISERNNTCLMVPNIFGFRQKAEENNCVPWVLSEMMRGYVSVNDNQLPWVYAEDIASFIWFKIETETNGIINMPTLGYMSEKDIANFILENNVLSADINIEKNNKDLVKSYSSNYEGPWCRDTDDMYSVLDKTVKWYMANKWAL